VSVQIVTVPALFGRGSGVPTTQLKPLRGFVTGGGINQFADAKLPRTGLNRPISAYF